MDEYTEARGRPCREQRAEPLPRREPAALAALMQGRATTQMAASRLSRGEPPSCPDAALQWLEGGAPSPATRALPWHIWAALKPQCKVQPGTGDGRLRRNGLEWVVGVLLLLVLQPLSAQSWKPLAEDGVHDPSNPALFLLQEPAEALGQLPPDTAGNQVRWVDALQSGAINPRTNIQPETKIEVLDLDIIMPRTGSAALVRFPHRQHTEWLDCSNCHDAIFKAKAGATPVDMLQILSGEYCGRCHGAVAFPLTECSRCHSVSTETQPGAVTKP